MPGAVQQGPNAVTNPQQLMSALQGQQPAPNPKTPSERLNPDQDALMKLKSAQYSLHEAQAYINDPHLLAAIDAMEGVLKKALLKFDGMEIVGAFMEAAQSLSPMLASAPGMQPPGGPPQAGPPGGGPPMGGPMPAGAPPQGVPLQ